MKSPGHYVSHRVFGKDEGSTPLEKKPGLLLWGVKSNTYEWCLKLPSNSLRGFTLIELILVLVIIGFLTALVAPAITSLTGLKLKTTARKMAAGLRYARSQAVATGSDYQVVFDMEKGEMIIESLQKEEKPYGGDYNDRGEEESTGEEEEDDSAKRMERRKTYTIPKDVKLAKVVIDGEEITEDQAWIDFYPNGSCSGGEIFLMDEKERAYRIALEFLTGVVTITQEEES